jgi:SAM-dependent methyltransferase
MALRLNLASGSDIKKGDGWRNLDVVPQWPGYRPCDLVWDARTEKIPFGDGAAVEVYAGYLFLHIPRRHHVPLLQEIKRVLAPGGTLSVREVDMAKVMPRYLEDPTDPRMIELIWGEQGAVHGAEFTFADTHVAGYTRATMVAFLQRAGFRDLRLHFEPQPELFWDFTLIGEK